MGCVACGAEAHLERVGWVWKMGTEVFAVFVFEAAVGEPIGYKILIT